MKTYKKPTIYVERFELSQHIAACAWDMTNQSKPEECTAQSDPDWGMTPGLTMFTVAGSFNVTPDVFESFCYTASSEGNNLFNS